MSLDTFHTCGKHLILNLNKTRYFHNVKTLASVGKVKFIDEITAIREEAIRLKRDGIKIIIALGHSGFEMDQMIAQNVEEVDVVVGGHTHTFLYSGTLNYYYYRYDIVLTSMRI